MYHGSKHDRNALNQRLIGVTQAERDVRRLQALSSKAAKFPSYMKPHEKSELEVLLAKYVNSENQQKNC